MAVCSDLRSGPRGNLLFSPPFPYLGIDRSMYYCRLWYLLLSHLKVTQLSKLQAQERRKHPTEPEIPMVREKKKSITRKPLRGLHLWRMYVPVPVPSFTWSSPTEAWCLGSRSGASATTPHHTDGSRLAPPNPIPSPLRAKSMFPAPFNHLIREQSTACI